MKYLTNYIEEAQSKALKDAGAFFAFSYKQFEEQQKPDTKYNSLGAGLFCPVDNAKSLVKELDRVHKAGIEQDIAENGITNIIKRELANHEAYYTGDIDSTKDALSAYNIPNEKILTIFKQEYAKQ